MRLDSRALGRDGARTTSMAVESADNRCP